eukprot:jgi/Chlat1/3684/Chrsp24S03845
MLLVDVGAGVGGVGGVMAVWTVSACASLAPPVSLIASKPRAAKLQQRSAEGRRRVTSCQAADVASVAATKQELLSASRNTQNGTACTSDQAERIAGKDLLDGLIKQLEASNPSKKPAYADLYDSFWELVYSSSTAASAGKLGPFVGYVTQEFLPRKGVEGQLEQYINGVEFGPVLKAALLATYKPLSDTRLQVKFINTRWTLLSVFSFTQDFKPSSGGWWEVTYVDNDLRILYANTGNVFVLRRVR